MPVGVPFRVVFGFVVVGHTVPEAGRGDDGVECVSAVRGVDGVADDRVGVLYRPVGFDFDTDGTVGELVHGADSGERVEHEQVRVVAEDFDDGVQMRLGKFCRMRGRHLGSGVWFWVKVGGAKLAGLVYADTFDVFQGGQQGFSVVT